MPVKPWSSRHAESKLDAARLGFREPNAGYRIRLPRQPLMRAPAEARVQHFVPKGFMPLAKALTLAGEHLYSDDWCGEETSSEVTKFHAGRFQTEIDTHMIGWLINRLDETRDVRWWLHAGRRLGVERTPKAGGRRMTADDVKAKADAKCSAATAILCELRHHKKIRDMGGHLQRIWEGRASQGDTEEEAQSDDIPEPVEEGATGSAWDLWPEDLEAMIAEEAEFRESYHSIEEAHDRFCRAETWLRQALCGTPPDHDDAVPTKVTSPDGEFEPLDPRLWASPNAADLIKVAIEAGERRLKTVLGTRTIRGHVIVHRERLLASFPSAHAITDTKQEAVAPDGGGGDEQPAGPVETEESETQAAVGMGDPQAEPPSDRDAGPELTNTKHLQWIATAKKLVDEDNARDKSEKKHQHKKGGVNVTLVARAVRDEGNVEEDSETIRRLLNRYPDRWR